MDPRSIVASLPYHVSLLNSVFSCHLFLSQLDITSPPSCFPPRLVFAAHVPQLKVTRGGGITKNMLHPVGSQSPKDKVLPCIPHGPLSAPLAGSAGSAGLIPQSRYNMRNTQGKQVNGIGYPEAKGTYNDEGRMRY